MGSKLEAGGCTVRVQVEIDAARPLTNRLEVICGGSVIMEIEVEYEYWPPQGVRYGVFGHVEAYCIYKSQASVDPVAIAHPPPDNVKKQVILDRAHLRKAAYPPTTRKTYRSRLRKLTPYFATRLGKTPSQNTQLDASETL
ncbi:hypothetical protein MLD38_025854 [Melastoma candidum]|uniref:Uncharacterized protein n=1 Tax=Melastoma candidum TaxID=119954 RepID=A0ACB9NWL0_9MYRT|nr:hypothetical protein MLD38_025854 [Melastoma candidum]